MFQKVSSMLVPKTIFKASRSLTVTDPTATPWGSFFVLNAWNVAEMSLMYNTIYKNDPYANMLVTKARTNTTTYSNQTLPLVTDQWQKTPMWLHNYKIEATITNASTAPIELEVMIIEPKTNVPYSITSSMTASPLLTLLATKSGQNTLANGNAGLDAAPWVASPVNASDNYTDTNNSLTEYDAFRQWYKRTSTTKYNISPGATITTKYSFAPKTKTINSYKLTGYNNCITEVKNITKSVLFRWRTQQFAADASPPANTASPLPFVSQLRVGVLTSACVQMGWINGSQTMMTNTVQASASAGTASNTVINAAGGTGLASGNITA